MGKGIKIFYIVDLLIILTSFIGMLIVDSRKTYGLEALTSVGHFVVLFFIFVISIVILILVSVIYFIIKMKNKDKK